MSLFHPTRFDAEGRPTGAPSGSEDAAFGVFTDRPGPAPLDALNDACGRLTRDAPRSASVMLPAASPGMLSSAWRVLPLDIAVLLDFPTAAGWVILPRSLGNGAQRDAITRDDVWRLMATLVADGAVSVELLEPPEKEARAEFSGASSEVLQRLAPSHARRLPAEIESRVERWLEDAASGSTRRGPERIAIQAGLLQWHDRLDASHQRSQSIEGEGLNQDGDYWHAIMHRREPDYANSKYWFRQLGGHPVFAQLTGIADGILSSCSDGDAASWRSRVAGGGRWNTSSFVDLCAACAEDEESPLGLAARRIQRAEMLLLLEQSCADAGC